MHQQIPIRRGQGFTCRQTPSPAHAGNITPSHYAMELKDVFGDAIYTCRLQLRRIRETDLPLLLTWSNCQEAFGPYLTPERQNAERLKEQFATNLFWNRHDKTLLIETRNPVRPIGTIHYWLKSDQLGGAVVAVKIATAEQRGCGYGTEAQKFLIIQLFDQVGVTQVEMYTDIDNKAQQRCLAKLGFSVDRSLTYDDHGVKRTGHLYRLTRKAFQRTAIYRYHYE
ncbi:GNAT family N-acetyltransferase [Desulfosarcina ovata]|uniref:GNAT family N-acetyltransferase n=1 Tax=Desulfosarcina ovata TaxID=83564 RepID=UPI001E2F7618|nr:GNAT family N-acetyltransferase [Desulfosarcina ovata]